MLGQPVQIALEREKIQKSKTCDQLAIKQRNWTIVYNTKCIYTVIMAKSLIEKYNIVQFMC